MSEVQNNQPVGYYDGVLDVYCAVCTTEGTATAAPVYDDPELMGASMEVTITPVYKEGKVYASNAMQRHKKKIDAYDVKLKLDQIRAAMRDKIFGRVKDKNGVSIISDSNEAPEVAIGFAMTLDDGSKELWWIYRGKFAESDTSIKTQEDKIEYQHPTVSARFERRLHDHALAATVSTADLGANSAVETGWFTKVYEPEFEAAAAAQE